ncbi:MAG: hypothetical protein M0Z54_07730 [Thermaerobacter sp.]|nr:hypothetical protein [Thermaerobacter sp.]
MTRLDTLSYWRGDHLPGTWGPASDLIVLDLAHMPARPQMARWADGSQVPTLVAARQPDGGSRRADLYDGRGRLVASQSQTHRAPGDEEPSWVADTVQVFDLAGHCLGILLGDDVLVPEVSRTLTLMGAELLIAVAAPRLPNYLGIWRESQQNQVIGFGGGAPPTLTVPCEADPGENGFLAMESLGDWVRATLPWGSLAPVREAFLLHQLNPRAYLDRRWWSP